MKQSWKRFWTGRSAYSEILLHTHCSKDLFKVQVLLKIGTDLVCSHGLKCYLSVVWFAKIIII